MRFALFLLFGVQIVEATTIFDANLSSGNSSLESGVFWVNRLYNSSSGTCDMRGTIRINTQSNKCYRFQLEFNNNPTGFNFHIDNGCGDGWGGTSGCYEVHNYQRSFSVFGRTGSGYRGRIENAISSQVIVDVRRGSVQFYNSLGLSRTFSNPTLLTNSYIYFSMNRVFNLNAFPNPPRVASGLCHVRIYDSCSLIGELYVLEA